jgi:hypothetical protein
MRLHALCSFAFMRLARTLALPFFALAASFAVQAHDAGFKHLHGSTNPAVPLNFVEETSGPIRPAPGGGQPVTGQGYWKFAAMKDLVPTPAETKPFLKDAHGTIIVDGDRDLVYWGLQKVGWVAFSNKMSQSWVVKGDPMFASGNLHGADIRKRSFGKLPLVVAADNMEGEVYLSDTSFQRAEKLDWPQDGPYKAKKEFMPTDAAFAGSDEIFVTDGYGKQWFARAKTNPLKFDGPFIGGREFSRTPHGITFNDDKNTMIVSARPEGQIKEYLFKKDKWNETLGLPPGSTVCDVDLWEDYALAPCLDGPNKAAGPIYIVNLKKKTIVSTLRMKEDLGYSDALHIHDAAWYVRGKGRDRELYIIFTNWNPGGIGAIKLVAN